MNWSDFFVKVFGSSSSKDEMELLNSWKQEGNTSVNRLSELSKPSVELGQVDLSTYKQYDVNSALEQSMIQIRNHRRSANLRYVFGAVIILILFAVGFNLDKNNESTDEQLDTQETFIASKGYFEKLRPDGTRITFERDAKLLFDEPENIYNLSGSAFFDVVKQKKTLQIITSQGKVQVMGTSFDIHVQGDLTTVLMHQGVITFIDLNEQSYSVSKGQLLIAKNDQVSIQEETIDQTYSYWRTKKLVYLNAPLNNVMGDLSRLFGKPLPSISKEEGELGVTVVFEDGNYSDMISELETITGVALSK